MIRELLDIFRGEDPDKELRTYVSKMMQLAEELIVEAGGCLFQGSSEVDRDAFYAKDRTINQLQQEIRKQLVGRLALSTAMERARFLVIFGLIKDVERLGDYAKNLLDVADLLDEPFQQGDEVKSLGKIREEVEESLRQTHDLLKEPNSDRARALMKRGKEVADHCEDLVVRVTRSNLPTSRAVPLALAARHYKRIQKHLTNALTTLVMPLHKVDYVE